MGQAHSGMLKAAYVALAKEAFWRSITSSRRVRMESHEAEYPLLYYRFVSENGDIEKVDCGTPVRPLNVMQPHFSMVIGNCATNF